MQTRVPNTRERILDLIKRKGALTAEELSQPLGISAVAVRRHLEALERDGLVATSVLHRPLGRPAFLYRLTQAAENLFPKAYLPLLVDFMEDVRASGGEERLNRLFEARNQRLRQSFLPRLEGKQLKERIQELMRILEEQGYLGSFQARDGSFLLKLHNCPVHGVAQRFHQTCLFERELLEQLLSAKVSLEATLVQGEPVCNYRIDPL